MKTDHQKIWQLMQEEALQASESQALLASFFHANILNHKSFASAMSFYLSHQLATDTVPTMILRDIIIEAMQKDASIEQDMLQDLLAHYTRDPACQQYITPFLYFKGYHAVQSYRIAHYLWQQKRTLLASYIQSRMTELFDVDIHPAAQIAGGLMVDHATGVVIGETAVVEKNVSMLHAVVLGGSGAKKVKRHPTIGQGVLLSVGAKVLGNIKVGQCVKVGAGSVVMESIPAHTTVVGVPARIVTVKELGDPAFLMDHQINI